MPQTPPGPNPQNSFSPLQSRSSLALRESIFPPREDPGRRLAHLTPRPQHLSLCSLPCVCFGVKAATSCHRSAKHCKSKSTPAAAKSTRRSLAIAPPGLPSLFLARCLCTRLRGAARSPAPPPPVPPSLPLPKSWVEESHFLFRSDFMESKGEAPLPMVFFFQSARPKRRA